jgi:hypothetical protein
VRPRLTGQTLRRRFGLVARRRGTLRTPQRPGRR